MGRAFLSARYTEDVQPAVPLPVDSSIHRWDQEEFDPDSEELGGHPIIREEFLPSNPGQDTVPDPQGQGPTDELPARIRLSRMFFDTESPSSSDSDSDSNSTIQPEQATDREESPPPDIGHRRPAPQPASSTAPAGPSAITPRAAAPANRAAMLLEIIARDRRGHRIISPPYSILPAEVSQSA